MITRQDLQQAIIECQNAPNPNANTCIKLAAFLTIEREMYGEPPEYSYAPPTDQIIAEGNSDFLRAIDGKNQTEVIPVLDELMSTLQIIQPKLYDAVMARLY